MDEGQEFPGGSFPIGRGFISEAIRSRQPRLIHHWSLEGPRVQVQYATDTPGLPEATITVPLLVSDCAIGVLSRFTASQCSGKMACSAACCGTCCRGTRCRGTTWPGTISPGTTRDGTISPGTVRTGTANPWTNPLAASRRTYLAIPRQQPTARAQSRARNCHASPTTPPVALEAAYVEWSALQPFARVAHRLSPLAR
jgi:hypothetical protein